MKETGKIRTTVLSAIVALCLLLAGSCARGPSENEIIFWHAMGRWEKDLLAIIDEYNALHPEMPVKAYNMSRYQALSQKIIAAVAASSRAPRKTAAATSTEMPRVASSWRTLHGRPCTEKDIDDLYADFLPLQLRHNFVLEHLFEPEALGNPEYHGSYRDNGKQGIIG